MKRITLKGKKLAKIGDSKGFIVDAAYVRDGQIVEDKLYDVSITESELQNSKGFKPVTNEPPNSVHSRFTEQVTGRKKGDKK